jgi:uncharacterized membrane-anchored protein YjiN (DUF445 family)
VSVIFESVIKINENNEWYIELTDTIDARVELCKDLSEYSKKVEELGANYGGNIDEVRWSKADNVPPHIMDTVRFEMSKLQREIEDEIGKPLIGDES